MDSLFDDRVSVLEAVAEGRHREVTGGLWDEMGILQLEFLKAHGLLPEHRFLDIGCGCLRAGVKLISYLNPGHYWGVDNNPSLLEVGWAKELGPLGLQQRQPREQLVCFTDFEFDQLNQTYDVALAQSVFTHSSLNRIRRCLTNLVPVMAAGGVFYATFLELPPDCRLEDTHRHEPGGVAAYSDRDPYHYRFTDLEFAAHGLPWQLEYIGDWNHPRGQKMAAFLRSDEAETNARIGFRNLSVDDASSLNPGDAHYGAFVGPPDRYDFMSATQFSLLFALGLRDQDWVLDFGCGSLRLGRLLIPFLREERYFGIEPEHWLIDDALDREHYPECVGYSDEQVLSMLGEAGLQGRSVAWYHPGANWMVAAHHLAGLPKSSELLLLRGAVLNQPQFAASLALDG